VWEQLMIEMVHLVADSSAKMCGGRAVSAVLPGAGPESVPGFIK